MLDRIRMCALVAVLCTCLVFSVPGLTASAMVRIIKFDDKVDERYVVKDLSELPHSGACASFCHKDVRCVAITFNTITGRCLLHSVHFYNMDLGVSRQGWRYFKLFADSCPRDYVYNRGAKVCFRHYLHSPGLWGECAQTCNERKSSLLIIDTAEKQAAVVRQSQCTAEYNLKNYWLGGYKDNGTWRWTDGREITVAFWYKPSVSLNDGNLAVGRNQGYKWMPLQNRRHFICEKANVVF